MFERGTAQYGIHTNSIVSQYCSVKGTFRTETVDDTNTLNKLKKNKIKSLNSLFFRFIASIFFEKTQVRYAPPKTCDVCADCPNNTVNSFLTQLLWHIHKLQLDSVLMDQTRFTLWKTCANKPIMIFGNIKCFFVFFEEKCYNQKMKLVCISVMFYCLPSSLQPII